VLRNVRWMLFRIFNIDKESSVIVSGDFNKVGMKKTAFIEQAFNLTRLLDDSQATHRLGGTLDNIWTNLPVTNFQLVD
jgi:hypothetical protein